MNANVVGRKSLWRPVCGLLLLVAILIWLMGLAVSCATFTAYVEASGASPAVLQFAKKTAAWNAIAFFSYCQTKDFTLVEVRAGAAYRTVLSVDSGCHVVHTATQIAVQSALPDGIYKTF